MSALNKCQILPLSTNSGDVWENWHKNLVKCVGRSKANDLFIQLWAKRGGESSGASTVRLRTYLEGNGLAITTSGFKKFQDFGSDVSEFFGGGIGALGTGMKIIWYGFVGVLVVGSAGLLYTVYRNPDKAVRIGSAIATRGKSEMIGGGVSNKMIGVKSK